MAISNILDISDSTIGLGLAVDNILGLVYFPFISWLGDKYGNEKREEQKNLTVECALTVTCDSEFIEHCLSAIAIAAFITACSEAIGKRLGLPALTISTAISVLLATTFPTQLQPMSNAGDLLGKLLLLLFFGSIGNSMGLISKAVSAPGALALAGFGFVLYSVHFAFIFSVGKLLRIPIPDLIIASNANIGNQATASSLASSKGWYRRLQPALLVGAFGNSIGTFLGLWLGVTVLRPLCRTY